MYFQPDKAWYALRVKNNTERMVAHGLIHLEIEHFLPVCKEESEDSRRHIRIEKPLFPGYVFCNADLIRGPKLYHVPGVIEIVSRARIPVAMAQEEIDIIRKIIDGARSVSAQRSMVVGQSVIVVKGPLRGLKGIYTGTDKSGHMSVSFPLLCRAVNIRIDRESLSEA